MSRHLSIILLVGVVVLTFAVMATAAVVIVRSYFTINDQPATLTISTPFIEETTVIAQGTPTPTASAEATGEVSTAIATFAATPPATASATATVPVASDCTDKAALVADVSVPDGTQVAPGSGFNKIWRIKNTGTCTWENAYSVVHTGGDLLGAVSAVFPLNATVPPGQSHDLIINMVSPATPGTFESDWKLKNSDGQLFGVGQSDSPFWVKIVVSAGSTTTISGLIYQDTNENGIYDNGEPLVGGREIWLVPNTACHVRKDPLMTVTSGVDGRYTLQGAFSGSYCVGVVGSDGFDDGVNVDLAPGQVMTDANLQAWFPTSSISGYLWQDYCLPGENGNLPAGNCVTGGDGIQYADGMIQSTEGYIPGVTVLLQPGTCASNTTVPVTAVTDPAGKYVFANLGPGTYCVSINATDGANLSQLLPGDWTFPGRGVGYQDITLQASDSAYTVNFGWDYQFK